MRLNIKRVINSLIVIFYLFFYLFYYCAAVGVPFLTNAGWLTTIEFFVSLLLVFLFLVVSIAKTKIKATFLVVNLLLFFVLIVVHSIFKEDAFVSIRQFTYWILLLLVFYYVLKNINSRFFVNSISILAIILSILHFKYGLGTKTIQQINSVYYLFLLLPVLIIPFTKKVTILQIIGVSLTVIACLLSNKGVVFLGFSLTILLIMFAYLKDLKVIAVFIFAIIFVLLFISLAFEISIIDLFLSSFDDGGNGRLDIYVNCMNLFANSGIIKMAFGGGNAYVSTVFGDGAHNEIIETLLDYGIVGLVLYLNILIYCIINSFKAFKKERHVFYLFFICFFLVTSLFSTLCFSYTRVLFFSISIICLNTRLGVCKYENSFYRCNRSSYTRNKRWGNRNFGQPSN